MKRASTQHANLNSRLGAQRSPRQTELHFRSPMLAAMPRVKGGAVGRTVRTAFRLAAVTITGLCLLLLIATVHNEWLPQGLGWVLYASHDYVFLPIKGYTFTLFHPYSWIWWGLAFLVTAFATVNWVANLNLVRRAHIRLLRWAIARPTLHPWLIVGVRVFQRLSFEPELMRAVAQDEWRRAMQNLTCSALDGAPSRVCRALGHITRFVLSLEQVAPHQDLAPWPAYLYWIQAVVYLGGYGAKNNGWFGGLMISLLKAMPPSQQQENKPGAASRPDPGRCFNSEQLEADLRRIRQHGQDQWSDRKNGEEESGRLLNQLAEASEERRRFFYDVCRHLEQQLSAPSLAEQNRWEDLSTIQSWETWLPIAGKVALDVTLYAALAARRPRLAAAFLDGVDSLRLLLDASVAWTPPGLEALAQDIPDSEAYRLVGLMLQAKLMEQQQQWQFELDSGQGILTLEDFRLSRETNETVIQAAGPVTDYH